MCTPRLMPAASLDGGRVLLTRDDDGHLWIDGERLLRMRWVPIDRAVALRTARREVYLARDLFERWYFNELL